MDHPEKVEKPNDNEVGISEDDRMMKARLQKYQILSQKSLDAIMFVDMEGNILEANDTAVKMYGYSFAEFSLMTIFDLRSSDKKSLILNQMGTAETAGIIFETVHYRKDGTFFPVEVSSQGTMIDGKPILVSIIRDTTKRKLAEQALQRSEEKYRNLIENSHDIIYTLSPEGVFTFVSPGWTALLGHSLAQVVGKTFQQFVHPDDIEGCQAFLQKTIETGQRQTGVEYRVLHIDGSWRWHTTNAIPTWDDSGIVIGFQGNASDITARKQSEEALRQSEEELRKSEEKYRSIFENISEGIFQISLEGNIISLNPAIAKIFGYTSTEDMMDNIRDVQQQLYVNPEDRTKLLKSLADHDHYNVETEMYHKNCRKIWMSLNVRAVRSQNGELLRIEGTCRDISEQKHSRELMRAAQQQMEQVIELLPDPTLVIDQQGRVVFWNRAMVEMTGITKEQIIGRSDYEYAIPFYGERRPIMVDLALMSSSEFGEIKEKYDFIGQEGDTFFCEVYVPKTYGGKGAYLSGSASKLYDLHGNTVGAIQSIRDITVRKQAEEELETINKHLEAAFLELFEAQNEMQIQYQQLRQQGQALRDSEQRLADIINFLPDATMVIDQQGKVVFWNKAIEEMTGVPKEQIIGWGDYEYAIPFYGERCPVLIDVSLMSSSEYDEIKGKYDFIRQEGDRLLGEVFVPNTYGGKGSYLLVSASKLYDLHGNTVGAIESIRDITDRKRAEEEREESQQRLEQVIELLPDATLVIDQQGQVVFWNKAMEEMSGVSKEQIIGRGNYEYTIPFYGERRPTLIDLVLMSSGEYDEIKGKYDFIRKEGDTLFGEVYAPNTYRGKGAYLLGAASRLIDRDGHIVGGIHSVRDITVRKELEKAKAKEAAIQKMTLLSIGDAVISTDNQGNIQLFNKVAEQLTGWTQEEAFGKPSDEVFNIINEFTRERCNNPVTDVLYTGKTMELANHTMLISKEGIERPIEDSAAPIKDDKGNINGVVLVFRDFTEKKERQAKIAYLSYHDQLTGLYNRRFFEEELRRLDTERNLPITMVMGDINGLKLTNDAFGHLAGDRLLIKVAEVMKKECRTDDIIARIGGDEFMFLLPRTDSDEAKIIIQRINATLAQEKLDSIILSVSFGWETKKTFAEPMTTIYKKAEDHMYRHKLSESSSMRNKAIKVIISTLYEKNKREEQHSQRVSKLCADIGIALNLSAADVGELRTGGLMHDIGKIALDENILNKPGRLNDGEWLEMKRHAETGYRILSSVNEFSQLAEYVLAHHERWDGKGYPKGLKGAKIPLQARIMAVADACDAMTSDRSYRKALSKEAVIEEMSRKAGKQFDPDIVQVLLEKVLTNGQWF